MSTRICVCPGTFDPVTTGHVDIIRRAATLFDEVIVAALTNPAKQPLLGLEQRLQLIQDAVADIPRVRVQAISVGLLVDFCEEVSAVAVVKGLRSSTDFSYEVPMALMNRKLSGLETVFLQGDPAFEHISSSLVKEVARFGGDVSDMVPPNVLAPLMTALSVGG